MRDARYPWETSRFVAASLTIINILYNCEWLPITLRSNLPKYLDRLTSQLRLALKEIGKNPHYKASVSPQADMRASATRVLEQVAQIRANKRSETPFFDDKVTAFAHMLNVIRDGASANSGVGGSSS